MTYYEISFPLFGEGFVVNPPSYISLFGFNLYLYGLFITLGFVLAGVYAYKRRDVLGLTQDNVLDLVIMAVPCGLVGARIYYALFNFSDYFGAGNWLNIFKIREGGLAVYGGVIASGIAFYVYSRIKKVHIGKLLDAAGFGLLIGQAVGRWGNFFNREAFGNVTGVPWKMGLRSYSGVIYVHPTFLYESLWNIIGLALIHAISKKHKMKYHGQVFLFYVAWYGFGRYMIEGLRADSLFLSGTDIRSSQLLAALSFSVAIALLLRNHLRGTKSLNILDSEESEELDELVELDALDESDTLEELDALEEPDALEGQDAQEELGAPEGQDTSEEKEVQE